MLSFKQLSLVGGDLDKGSGCSAAEGGPRPLGGGPRPLGGGPRPGGGARPLGGSPRGGGRALIFIYE